MESLKSRNLNALGCSRGGRGFKKLGQCRISCMVPNSFHQSDKLNKLHTNLIEYKESIFFFIIFIKGIQSI